MAPDPDRADVRSAGYAGDGYSGDVVPGGPPAVRELATLTVRKIAVGPLANNAFLLTCRTTGAQLLIDAAADAAALLGLVRSGSPVGRLDLVLTTHRHADHQGALADVVAATGAPTAAGTDDADGIAVPTSRRLRHGEKLAVGDLAFEVIALRGHTPGSVALAYAEPGGSVPDVSKPGSSAPGRVHLFTGDSLFPGGPGKTQDAAAFASLMDDLEERVFNRFPDDTWVYPGHGNDTTLGAERPALPAWRARGW